MKKVQITIEIYRENEDVSMGEIRPYLKQITDLALANKDKWFVIIESRQGDNFDGYPPVDNVN